MRSALLPAGCIALALLLPAAGVGAQSALEAPSITSVTAGDTTLEIVWSAPESDGGSAVTAYDLRYIRSDASSRADDDWTLVESIWSAGVLEYELTGLSRDTSYDLQVRAVNANGDGPWSDPPFTEGTSDHGDTRGTATAVQLPSSFTGRIDSRNDEDWFSITLTERTDLWFYTTGAMDTVGELFKDDTSIANNDDSYHSDGLRNFAIPAVLEPGTYYVRVTSLPGETAGSYTFHTTATTTAGLSFETATTVSPGTPIYTRVANASDDNYFTFTVAEQTPVWMRSAMPVDMVATLYDSDRRTVAENDDGFLGYDKAFSMAPVLDPGTYYLKVERYRNRSAEGYILQVDASEGPGNTTATALPMSVNALNLGRITSTSDRDYFRLDVDPATFVMFFGRGAEPATAVSARLLDAGSNEVRTTSVASDHMFHQIALLPSAGTYYIEASSGQSGEQRYVMQVESSAGDEGILNICEHFENSQADSLYGCQWHLNNTGQFGGAGHDINVEEVWESTKGEGVNIAIMDDGLQYSHPDLSENVITSRNYSYYGDDVYAAWLTHGTGVAGLIAARDNELGVRGVAPRASIYVYLLPDITDARLGSALTRDLEVTAISSNSWGSSSGRLLALPATTGTALVRGVQRGSAARASPSCSRATCGRRCGVSPPPREGRRSAPREQAAV